MLDAAVLACDKAHGALGVAGDHPGLVVQAGEHHEGVVAALVRVLHGHAGLHMVAGQAKGGVSDFHIVGDAADGRDQKGLPIGVDPDL